MMRGASKTRFSWSVIKGLETSDVNTIHADFINECQRKGLVIPKGVEKEFQKRLDASKTKEKKSKLDFSKTQFQDEHLEVLLDILDDVPLVAKIVLVGNPITQRGADKILKLLKNQVHMAKTTPLDRRLNVTFLSSVELKGSNYYSTLSHSSITEIEYYSEILNYLNAQTRIRSQFLHLKIADPIPIITINAFWTSLFGTAPPKVKDYFKNKTAELGKANIDAIPYAGLEKHFLFCLEDLGEVNSLTEKQQFELIPDFEEAPMPKFTPPPPTDTTTITPPVQNTVQPKAPSQINSQVNSYVNSSVNSSSVTTPTKVSPVPSQNALFSQAQTQSAPTTTTTSIENATKSAAYRPMFESPQPQPQPAVTPITPMLNGGGGGSQLSAQQQSELVQRNDELEKEVIRLNDLINDMEVRQILHNNDDDNDNDDDEPTGEYKEEVRMLQRENQKLRAKNTSLRLKYEKMLLLMNKMEVERADAIVRSRLEVAQFMGDDGPAFEDETF